MGLNARIRKAQRCAERSTALARQKQRELETDVAARRRLEGALRESEERFRGMFDNAPIPIAVGDLKGRCILANKAACDFIGVTSQEVIGTGIEDIVHPEDLHLTAHLFPRLIAGQIPSYTVVRRYRHKSGSIVWGQASVTLVRDRRRKTKLPHGGDGRYHRAQAHGGGFARKRGAFSNPCRSDSSVGLDLPARWVLRLFQYPVG